MNSIHCPKEISFDNFLDRLRFEQARFPVISPNAGIRDQNVDMFEFFDELDDGSVNRARVSHICGKNSGVSANESTPVLEFLKKFPTSGQKTNCDPFSGESDRQSLSDAARCSRKEDPLVLPVHRLLGSVSAQAPNRRRGQSMSSSFC